MSEQPAEGAPPARASAAVLEAEPPPSPPQAPAGTWTGVAAALLVGVGADAVIRTPPGVGMPLVALAAGVGVIALARPTRAALPFFAGGLLLMSFAIVRADPLLILFDVICAIGLYAWGAAFAREGAPTGTSLRAYTARSLSFLASVPRGFGEILGPAARAVGDPQPLRRLPRTALLVVPVVGVFALLLASADPVFAHILRRPFVSAPLSAAALHAFWISAGAVGFGVLLARSRSAVQLGSIDAPNSVKSFVGPMEWKLVLGAVDVLFALFVAVQFGALFGGRTRVLEEAGLTYAAYARSGFAQLLVAAALTGALIAGVGIAGDVRSSRDRAMFRCLSGILLGLSLVVLASSFRRLTLYEGAFGYTDARLVGHAAILFVGALLVCGAVAISIGRSSWLPTAAIALGFLTVLGLNSLGPDRFIAEHNIARYAASGKLDQVELMSLSPDAAPAIVAALPSLSHTQGLREFLACERDHLRDEAVRYGWTSFNVARDRAIDALERASLGACPDVSEYYSE